jgi:hypothetical protein
MSTGNYPLHHPFDYVRLPLVVEHWPLQTIDPYAMKKRLNQGGADHQPPLFRAFVVYHLCCFTCSIDETVDSMAHPRRTRGNLLRIV